MDAFDWTQGLATALAIVVALWQVLNLLLPILGVPSAVGVLRDQLDFQNQLVQALVLRSRE